MNSDRIERCRIAWETHGDRAALGEALEEHLKDRVPLPEWIGVPVLEAVVWWAQKAPLNRRGRHARWRTTYREALDRYAYASEVDDARAHGRTYQNAVGLASEWFNVDKGTIKKAYRHVRRRVQRGDIAASFLPRAAEDYLDRYHLNAGNFCPRCKTKTVWDEALRGWVCPAGHSEARGWYQRRWQRWIALLEKYPPRRGWGGLYEPGNSFREF